MATNIDPRGILPRTDHDGNLKLRRPVMDKALIILIIIAVSVMGFLSILYLYRLHLGVIPTEYSDFPIPIIAGIPAIAIFMIPLLLKKVFDGDILIITKTGISLRQNNKLMSASWDDISNVQTRIIVSSGVATGYNSTSMVSTEKTLTLVTTRNGEKISWEPIFGVSPNLIVEYLVNLHARYSKNAIQVETPRSEEGRIQANELSDKDISQTRLAINIIIAAGAVIFIAAIVLLGLKMKIV